MRKPLFCFVCLAIISCDPPGKFQTGTFGDVPVNLDEFNSPYDDYNSTSPIVANTSALCFSSNRGSSGGQFDVVYKLLEIVLDHRSGQISVAESKWGNSDASIENSNIANALSKLNTPSDELGPFLIPKGLLAAGATNINKRYQSYLFLYSSNEGGNQDIRFLHNLNEESYTDPKSIVYLNSDKEDAYPTVMQDSSAIYFCSDRAGKFDIYQAPLNKNVDLLVSLSATLSQAPVKDEVLSSEGDDKCPFIFNNLLVFASNRDGGFGGYDLYYSLNNGGKWSAPVNFGESINTAADEFRPIVKPMEEFTNDFMLFSSNRSGGKGGFDLYYVGIPKMIVP